MNIPRSIPAVVTAALLLTGAVSATAQNKTNEVKRTNNIEFAKPDGVALLLDLYMPVGVENPPLIMFMHGGGWKNGNRKNCKMSWASKYGYAIASVEYRLSQEAIFPAQIHDCKGALRWLRANAEKYGYNADKVVVAGTSAGGHLALLMGVSGGVKELEGTTGGNLDETSTVQGIIDYYGPTDFVYRSKSQPVKTEQEGGGVFHLLGGKASENLELAKAASPVTYVTKDDPPLVILHGEKDDTVFIKQSHIMKEHYEKNGLEVEMLTDPNARHGWRTPLDGEMEVVLSSLKNWYAEE